MMNQTYRLVWSLAQQAWVVAGELARGRKKSSAHKALSMALLLAGVVCVNEASAVPALNGLPTGESVVSGSASFDRSVDKQLTINQSSSKLITNWNSFDVGSNGKVVFAQPDTASIALNRVTSGSASEIFGQVSANGKLVIVNPSGITFGASSQVSAASIIGSVLDIQDSDFNNNTLLFSRGIATGAIDNKGSLTATAGSVSLLAPAVKNSGSIRATGGNASLINADAVNLSAADPSISTASTITGLIQQSGNITATQMSNAGGKILLTGDTSQTGSQIQLAGTLDATTSTSINGRTILINGDVNLNGVSNVLNLNSSSGYSLSNAAVVNLNGISSGFRVNGAAYTVVRNVNQLQAMESNLAGKYVLGNNIDASDTVNWNSGSGFSPIGFGYFSGVLDGLGHQVNGLTINRSGTDFVGLFSAALNATFQNIGLTNLSVKGADNVGGLVGWSDSGSISNSYVSGSVTGTQSVGGLVGLNQSGIIINSYASGSVDGTNMIGGLVGHNRRNKLSLSISNSYASGSVKSTYSAGGLVGWNENTIISNSYASGSVKGTSDVGGLVASHEGIISNSYASGSVKGTYNVGGLVGDHIGSISNSYWNSETSGQSQGIGRDLDETINTLTGLTTAQSKQLSSYANWGNSIDAQGGTGSTWRIYEGQSAPLLRTFLKPLIVTINNQSTTKTYDGTTASLSYSLSDALADGRKLVNDFTGRNVGSYAYSAGLSSVQDGYDLFLVNDGTLTINKKLLTIAAATASKTYDGKLTAVGKPVVTGNVRGDTVVGLTQSFADKNAGTGKTILVNSGYTIRDGNNGNNYDVVVVNSNAGVITPKALTISTVANSKVYDGGLSSAKKPVVTGLITGDRVTGLFQQYETKTVGENKKLLIKNGYVLQDGNNGSNYVVTEQGSNDGVITAH